jgi:hypothetical protein
MNGKPRRCVLKPRCGCSGIGKKATRRARGEDVGFDEFTAADFAWLDDPAKVAAAAPEPQDLPRGMATRTLQQLEAALLPAVNIARDLFRAIAKGQPHPPADLAIMSVFDDYRHYLHELHASLAADGEEPGELFAKYDASIGHVLGCFDKLLRGEGVSRVEALKADAWLRNVLSETLLFNLRDLCDG